MKNSIIIIFIIFFSDQSLAKNVALLIGGGCEPVNSSRKSHSIDEFTDVKGPAAGHYNLFRPSMENAWQALSRNGWQVEMQYDSDTWEKPWPDSKSASVKSINTYLSSLMSGKNKLNDKDQLFLGINTHGSSLDHCVCIGDFDCLPVRTLKNTLKEIKSKTGAKIAILDASCYSGKTIEIMEDLPICSMSNTNPNTTGTGGVVWSHLFGLGLAPGTKIPDFYVNQLPSGNPDINRDGKLSATEGFHFGRLHSSPSFFPRISDCRIKSDNIEDLVNEIAPFLRSPGIDGENVNYSPDGAQLCQIEKLTDKFVDLLKVGQNLDLNLIREEMLNFGVTVDSFSSEITKVRQGVLKFKDLMRDSELSAYYKIIDSSFYNGSKIPIEIVDRVREKTDQARNIKRSILKSLHFLLYARCSLFKKRNKGNNHCDDFIFYDQGEHN